MTLVREGYKAAGTHLGEYLSCVVVCTQRLCSCEVLWARSDFSLCVCFFLYRSGGGGGHFSPLVLTHLFAFLLLLCREDKEAYMRG